MNKFDEMLDTLRKSVGEIAAAPEEGRGDLLEKSFQEFREAVHADEPDVEASVLEGLAKMGAAAGIEDGDTGVAQFAGVLRGVEVMLDNLSETAMAKADGSDTAGVLHEIVDGWYGLGIRLLEVAAAVDSGSELEPLSKDDIGQIEGDFERVRSAIGLAKAVPPQFRRGEEEEGAEDEGDDPTEDEGVGPDGEMEEGDEGPEVDDSEPLDPLDTLQRLLAAALVTVDAIRNADGGAEEEEDPGMGDEDEAEAAVERAEKAVHIEGLAKAHGSVLGAEAEAAADAAIAAAQAAAEAERLSKAGVEAELRKAQADLKKLQDAPAASKARISGVALSKEDDGRLGGADLNAEAERLAKLAESNPDAARRELFKAALSNPLKI